MQIDPQTFATGWIAAWNAHDVEAVLDDYDPDIVFLSAYAERVLGNGRVSGIDNLRTYWRRGLETLPDLHFTLETVLVGYECLTIVYRNHRQQTVAETVEFNAANKVIRSFACYSP